jgi:gliding motility-associated-like protein
VGETSSGTLCPEIITRTYNVADACGNSINVTQLITIDDNTPPSVSDPAPVTVECIEDVPAVDINVVTGESDNCTGPITVAFVSETNSGTTCPEIITRIYSVTDACGNTVNVSHVITVDDNTAPTATDPAPVTVECIEDVPPVDINVVTDEADNCSGPVVVAFVGEISNGNCPLIITRTYSITDACGNSLTVTHTINVHDDIPPTASNPANITVECVDEVPPADINIIADEADNCSGPVVVAFLGEISNGLCPQLITRTYSVTDACGNSITVSQLITVFDDISPSASNPPDINIQCTADFPLPDISVVTDESDNCTGPVVVAFVGDVSDGQTCPETIIRTYSITDACGNTTNVTQTITVHDDIFPTASDPAPVDLTGCNGHIPDPDDSVVTDEADNCGTPFVNFVSDSTNMVGCTETTIRTYSISDECNNTIFVHQVITRILDTIPPVFGNVPLDTIIDCEAQVPPMLPLPYTDNCSQSGVVTGTETGPIGDPPYIIRTWTISDDCGNASTLTQIIFIDLQLIPINVNAEFCFGQTVTVNGVIYDTPGIYLDTIPSTTGGCDTALIINVSEVPLVQLNVTADYCSGHSVNVYGIDYSSPGIYMDTIPSSTGGCDTAVTITINELPLVTNTISEEFCAGQSVTINGVVYTDSGVYTDTIPSTTGGCDTILTINITELPLIDLDLSAEFCYGESVTLYGILYEAPGIYFDTIPSTTGGCDTAAVITIIETPLVNQSIEADICIGESVVIYGILYDHAGVFLDTIPSTTGTCDTAVAITISELPFNTNLIQEDICEGQSVTIYGITYTDAGTYLDTIASTTGGCDTVVTIQIIVTPYVQNSITASYCTGESVVVYGITYDTPGIYQDTIPSLTGGCDTAVTITINEINFIPAQITPAGPLCTSAGTITLTAIPPGGVWSGDVSDDQFDPALLGPGTHEVIYSINTGSCQTADTINIIVYEMTIACEAVQDESNVGAHDGIGQVTITGGLPPYSIDWSGPTQGSGTLPSDGVFTMNGLSAGLYTVVVTDASGCISQCQFIITVPCDLAIDNILIQDATCGMANGSLTVIATGTMPPFEYSLDGINYQSSNTFTGLIPGSYTVFVRDTSGCFVTEDIDILSGPSPQLSIVEIVNASCGVNNGSIEVEATGGSLPYTFSIDGINYGFSPLFPGLGTGDYLIYLIDNSGCTDTIAASIIATDAPVINNINITDATCGQDDGSIFIEASGGSGTLMYSIDGVNFQLSPLFGGLSSGTYTVTVKDDAGCQVTGTATIQDVGGPSITAVAVVPATCGLDDGSITITANGNTQLMYSINCINYVTTNVFNNLPAGNYTICVKDQNGCITSQPVVINTTNGPQILNVQVTHTTCGEENGTITITASGGNGDLEYFINGISFGDDNTTEDWPAGTYDIVVSDENGCSASDQVTINPSESPDFDIYIDPAHCGHPDGSIELDGFGGMPPYLYSINGGPFRPLFTFVNLVSDDYTLAIKDAKGCIHEEVVFLWEEPEPKIDDVIVTEPTCDNMNGQIEVLATGSNLMYSINSGPFQASNIFSSLDPGTYVVHIKDEFGCTDEQTVILHIDPVPVIDSIQVVNIDCNQSVGSIHVYASGGLTPLMYALNNGPFGTSPIFTSLSAGIYTVHVKGANGCEDSELIEIDSDTGTGNSTISASICIGEEFLLEGQVFNTSGVYQITIPGGAHNGCDSIITLQLSVNPLQQKTINEVICQGDTLNINGVAYTNEGQYLIDTIPALVGCDTILTLDLSVTPYDTTYLDASICDGDTLYINGMIYTLPGEYTIDTTNSVTGCDSIQVLRLQVNPLNTMIVDVSICFGEVYTINGIDYDVAGIYLLDTIPGQGGCDTIRSVNLSINPLPVANAGPDKELTCAVTSVVLDGTASGGTPLWSGPGINAGNQSSLTPTVSIPGTYTLTVTSSEGCQDSDIVVITASPDIVIADAGEDDFFSCLIDTVILHAGPLGPNLVYQWSGPGINASNEHQTDPVILVPGTYTLIVTNTVTGCISAPDSVFIDDITNNIVAIIQDPLSLTCFSTFINLDASESSSGPNIVYIWMDDEGHVIGDSPHIDISQPGTFMFIVKDTVTGCFDNDTVLVQDLSIYPPVNAGDPQQLDCIHTFVTLNEGATYNLPNIMFHWTGPAGGILSNPDSLTILVGTPGEYFLMATDTALGCTNSDSVTVTNLAILPVADIGVLQTFTCIETTAMLDIGNSTTGAGITYLWNGPTADSSTTTVIEPTEPGYYFLTVFNGSTGCVAEDSVLLLIPEAPFDLLADMVPPFCQGDATGSITVTDVFGGTEPYLFSLNGGTPQTDSVFGGLSAGTYILSVLDANGCAYQDTFEIPDGTSVTLDLGPDIELDWGDSIQLVPIINLPWSLIDSIVWEGPNLSCLHCITPTLYGFINEIITATVYAGGCEATDHIVLHVDLQPDVYIPNVFSPNGDGKNDHVTVFANDKVRKVVYLEIFDRWGNNVFKANDFVPNDPLLGWDGTFRGLPMNPAVFAYVAKVELINGAQIPYKGDITLLR